MFVFIYLWPCWVFVTVHSLALVVASKGYSLAAGFRLLTAVPSLGSRAHELHSVGAAHGLQSVGSAVVVHGLSCTAARGIFLDQGMNLCLLNCKRILYHWATWEALLIFIYLLIWRQQYHFTKIGFSRLNCLLLQQTIKACIKAVSPKGNQSWIFVGKSDAEAETPVLWPPDAKNWRTGKDPDVGKDWRWEVKGTTEDEMVGWHHWLNGHEFE